MIKSFALLNRLREFRAFDAQVVLTLKIKAINSFFEEERLNSAVVGISGGIDSAVSYALLKRAGQQKGSPIKKIIPLFIWGGRGVSGQPEGYKKASDWLGEELHYCNMFTLTEYAPNSFGRVSSNWAIGQFAPMLRTSLFYYHAALLQDEGYKSIVVGTVNRDEGGYIGYYGKGSDMMVDLQIIGDLHKSEIYKLADLLGVPDQIKKRKPTGDVWDGKSDLEVIGATYDQIELFTLIRDYPNYCEFIHNQYLIQAAENENSEEFANIEKLHKKNLHKYKTGVQCRFIDVMKRAVEGGWK